MSPPRATLAVWPNHASRRYPSCASTPIDLQVGHRLTAVTGEWDVIGPPFTTAAGKTVHARVRKVTAPPLTELLTWEADERISVRREEGKR
jgi:hypothetical protein